MEYALEAVSFSGTALGIQTDNGITLLAEKKVFSPLLEGEALPEKLFPITKKIYCAVAGVTADANELIEHARQTALSYERTFGEPISVEKLAQEVCNLTQQYTQVGGMRPYGVGMLLAGWDDYERSFHLFQTDPSGNYSKWMATCIGNNGAAAMTTLKEKYTSELSLQQAVELAFQIFSKNSESATLSGERVELCTMERVDANCFLWKRYSAEEISLLLAALKIEVVKK